MAIMPDKCGFCGEDAAVWIINPDLTSEHSLMCVSCGISRGVYCVKHSITHMGFNDGTTACRDCINQEVKVGVQGQRQREVASQIEISLDREEFQDLQRVAEPVADVRGCDQKTVLLYFAVTKAHRLRKSLEETLDLLRQEGKAAFLLT